MKKHTPFKSKFNAAFSLVELLVVIAVIAVIAAIAIPNITGTREAAQGAVHASEQADADRFNAQIKALGGAGDNTVTAFKTGVTQVTAQGVTMTFKLD
jgi:prepilin-type N-terminal cleavage/methylation domain-containing protein